ncbi:MAG: hypothetical protein IT162_02835 [Bryobacterales bacterium]|nr:hypothetical protein [Bryobacterales bacterium]
MFPPALALFLLASAAGVYLAFSRSGHGLLGGFTAAANTALALYEFSFTRGPVREWIRVDLLITLPFALACLVASAALGWRARNRPSRPRSSSSPSVR